MNKITYYFGAGASYNSVPILNELSLEMIEFGRRLLEIEKHSFEEKSHNPWDLESNPLSHVGWELLNLGTLSKNFNTIDTYARKLYANNALEDLSRLKNNLSIFFSLWQVISYRSFASRSSSLKSSTMDQRYISLIATFLPPERSIRLRDNINFITWNYDLQLQLAYLKFADPSSTLTSINRLLPYFTTETQTQLKICHLNGYCGRLKIKENRDIFLLEDLLPLKDFDALVFSFKNIIKGKYTENPGEVYSLNFAWEKDNHISQRAINAALELAKETETLVIIGYSFPIFNREIDTDIIRTMVNNKLKRIYYQSKEADETFLRDTFGIYGKSPDFAEYDVKITIEKNNMDQFIIPHT